MILPADFFARDTLSVARELPGHYLYRRTPQGIFRGIIAEVEAYHGPEDAGCHCAKGLTPRTRVMFGPPGHIYVYLIYGMYDMLNIVTMPQGFPAAVLIRGLLRPEFSKDGQHFEPLNKPANGPGKLTRLFGIDRRLNTMPLGKETGLWVAKGLRPAKLKTTPRIGIDYAGEWKYKPWRFVIEKL